MHSLDLAATGSACNGDTSSHRQTTSFKQYQCPSGVPKVLPTGENDLHDLVCVGFGPASLAIAVALQDALESQHLSADAQARQAFRPKVCFLEKQRQFAWHAGMLLPGAKMQISFVKDLATLRNPRSQFTFLNYLHTKNRLVQFTNLGTFLPLRREFEDYLRWCAGHFDDLVHYGQEVLEIVPGPTIGEETPAVSEFLIRSRDTATMEVKTVRSRHVVIAVGGKPRIPKSMPQNHRRVIHSSGYSTAVPALLNDRERAYRIAVIGSGQSAAEVFNDLYSRYPNAYTSLIVRGGALRPSDDSPLSVVNEIFDPERVDQVYRQHASVRQAAIAEDRSTNYGVVRLELLEHIYADMYSQRLIEPDETKWRHRILPHRNVTGIREAADGESMILEVEKSSLAATDPQPNPESQEVDLVIVATGYMRNLHEDMLQPARHLMSDADVNGARWTVGRDYRVAFADGAVSDDAGIWLQGCNESTHGLSDSLLSILATRGGELVKSIFGVFKTIKDLQSNGPSG